MVYADEQGLLFRPEGCGSSMTLAVTDWQGPGHYARGSFGGTLYDASCAHSVVISGGAFEGWIAN